MCTVMLVTLKDGEREERGKGRGKGGEKGGEKRMKGGGGKKGRREGKRILPTMKSWIRHCIQMLTRDLFAVAKILVFTVRRYA